MGIIFVLLAISLSLAIFFLGSFIWASKSGQYDDNYGPSIRLLFEDEIPEEKPNSNQKNTEECK